MKNITIQKIKNLIKKYNEDETSALSISNDYEQGIQDGKDLISDEIIEIIEQDEHLEVLNGINKT